MMTEKEEINILSMIYAMDYFAMKKLRRSC